MINHAAQRNTSESTQCRAHLNKHFKTVFFIRFRTSVLLSKRRSSHSVAANYSSFSRVFSENSTDPSSFVGFDVIYIHRSLRLVLAVLLLSLTPATVSPNFAVNHSSFSYVYCENSTVLTSKIFFSFRLGAVLLSSSTPATVTFVFRNLRSLCVSVLCCC